MSLFTCVVIPCLNEQDSLESTCKSLGFGEGVRPPENSALIIVDNGSTDRTRVVAQNVMNLVQNETVFLREERERGYVPPRDHGNLFAVELAKHRGFSDNETLLIQADADTNYSSRYIDEMRQCALQEDSGVMLECCMTWATEFASNHSSYLRLCDEVDAESATIQENMDDVIVDDKGCAYRASDYAKWGGHLREFRNNGDELLSESSRLYIRARSHGGKRSLCPEASAKHSARRILSEPSLSFATAGFPREASFIKRWEEFYRGPDDIESFVAASNRSSISLAILSRRAHLWGLFELLPKHLTRALEGDTQPFVSNGSLLNLPYRTRNNATETPGIFLDDVLEKIDERIFRG
jgi:glycosyltransferase involved in cell wall biosynthesis